MLADPSNNVLIPSRSTFFDLKLLGSKSNHDGDSDDNVDQKIYSYFTYESCGTQKSFTLFITVKTITKLNLEHSYKFKIEI